MSYKYIHNTIHKYNRNINYVRSENCRYCAVERKESYGNYATLSNLYNSIGTNFEHYWSNIEDNEPYYQIRPQPNIEEINVDNNDNCTICLRTFKHIGIKLGNCGHIFHRKCMNTWLHYNNNCPLCRTNIMLQ